MKVDLKNYLDARDKIRDYESTPGPVVTISRAFGCEATPVAAKLLNRIKEASESRSNQGWRIVSKEILNDAAAELHVNPVRIEKLMDSKGESTIGSMFSSLGNFYGLSDKKVIETLKDVIEHYAHEGKSVIIGRGGAYITRRIPQSLHIKLQAPFDWRVSQMQEKRRLSKNEAKILVMEMDTKRTAWVDHITHGNADLSVYDIIFNRQTMNDDMIVDTLYDVLIDKKMISAPKAELVY